MHCLLSTTQVYAGRPSGTSGLSVGPRVWAHSSSSLRCRVTLLLYACCTAYVGGLCPSNAVLPRFQGRLFVVAWRTDRLRQRRMSEDLEEQEKARRICLCRRRLDQKKRRAEM